MLLDSDLTLSRGWPHFFLPAGLVQVPEITRFKPSPPIVVETCRVGLLTITRKVWRGIPPCVLATVGKTLALSLIELTTSALRSTSLSKFYYYTAESFGTVS